MKHAKKKKNVSNSQLSRLGVSPIKKNVEKLEDLINNPPNIVIAEAISDLEYSQNNYPRKQKFTKKQSYIMSLGVYDQVWINKYTDDKILKPSNFKFSNQYRPYKGQSLDNKTLLIWRQGGIGDLLFISPNLRYLKNKYPTSNIILGCGPQYQSMVKTWDFVDKIIDLPFNVSYLYTANSDYHCIFEGVIERCKEAETENAYRLFSRWMGLSLPDEDLIPIQKIPDGELQIAKVHINQWGLEEKNFIVLQFRASSPIRTPRPEIWKKIIDYLTSKGNKIVIIDSVNNITMTRQFIEFMKDKHMIFNFAEYSDEILKTMAITSLSKMAIATDSALLHIAESLKVKNFGLFGPFPGSIRLSTYKYSDWIDCKKDCSPCFIHSQYLCNRSIAGYSSCYDTFNIDEVIDRIQKHLDKEL